MNVEQVERAGVCDLKHFRRQRERVRRMVKERVAGDFDFVEMDIGIAVLQADGLRVADEMDVVAARGEFHAKLGGDDAGTAIGGVARDADAHVRGLFRVG
jgi:hypothetical protein